MASLRQQTAEALQLQRAIRQLKEVAAETDSVLEFAQAEEGLAKLQARYDALVASARALVAAQAAAQAAAPPSTPIERTPAGPVAARAANPPDIPLSEIHSPIPVRDKKRAANLEKSPAAEPGIPLSGDATPSTSGPIPFAPERPATPEGPAHEATGLPPIQLSSGPGEESRIFGPLIDVAHEMAVALRKEAEAAEAAARDKEIARGQESAAWAELMQLEETRKRHEQEFNASLADQHAARKKGLSYETISDGAKGPTIFGQLAQHASVMKDRISDAATNFGQGKIGQAVSGAAYTAKEALTGKAGQAVAGGASALASGAGAALAAVPPVAQALVGGFNALLNTSQTLSSALGPFTQLVQAVDPGLVTMFNMALEDLNASLGQSFRPLIEAGREVANVFNSLFTQLAPAILPVVQQLSGAFSEIVGVVANAALPILESLAGTVGTVVNALVPVVGQLTPVFEQLASLVVAQAEAMGPLVEAVLPVFSALVSVAAEILSSSIGVYRALYDAVTPLVRLLVSSLAPVLASLGPLIGALSGIFSSLMMTYVEVLTPLIELFTTIAGAVLPVLVSVITTVTGWLTTLANAIRDLVAGIGAAVRTLEYMMRTVTTAGAWSTENLNREFNRAFASIRLPGATAPRTPQGLNRGRTFAARPARAVGIEDIGRQAREAAFGSANVPQQQLQAQQRMVDLLTRMLQNFGYTREEARRRALQSAANAASDTGGVGEGGSTGAGGTW
jgi:hypothetical protein